MRRDIKPDAQPFDQVIIKTVPRYKESGLSGDEWRISGEIEFWRKGKLIKSSSCRNVETACYLVGARLLEAIDNGHAMYAGEGDACDQEGCHEPATIIYRKKAHYNNQGHKTEIYDEAVVRRFCDKHKTRGDCGLDDADSNYAVVSK